VVTSGSDVRRVEVKGSSGAAAAVELTRGEVKNSRKPVPTDLYVMDGIQWSRDVDGVVSTWDGEARLWSDWTANESRLRATHYRYTLPGGFATV
ncbi:MAG: hypothetical protein JWN97_3492, partial [Nocardioides sp.]|nr:hypothetical protein [Nocardioides sp.]